MFRLNRVIPNPNATNRPFFSNTIRVTNTSQTKPQFLKQNRNGITFSTTKPLTNQIQLDSFLRGLDATGTISISLQFEDFPTASFSLLVKSSSIGAIRTRFKNFKYLINFYGIPFRVVSYNEDIAPYPQNRHIVSVQLEGWNKYLCDKSIYVKTKNKTKTYTLSDVAKKVKVSCTNVSHPIKSNDLFVNTNLRNVINTVSQTYGMIPDYTKQQITLTRYNSGQGFSIPSQKIINLTLNYNQNNVDGFIYEPVYLEWNDPQTKALVNETTQLREKPTYKQIRQPQIEKIVNPENAQMFPANVTTIKTLDMNFDVSGNTKTWEKTVKQGDKLIRKQTQIYGFKYSSRDMTYNSNDNTYYMSPASAWTLVESTTTDYIYDTNYGYYLGSSTYGGRYVRYEVETEGREYDRLVTESNDSKVSPEARQSAREEAKLYEFFWQPIREEERLQLRSFHSVYKDDEPEPEQVYDEYDRVNPVTRKIETKYERNLAYVLPMFVEKRYLYKNSFSSVYFIKVEKRLSEIEYEKDENGELQLKKSKEKTDVIPTYKTTGEERLEITTVDILPSNNTYEGGNGLEGTTRENADRYIEYQKITSAQNSGFKENVTEVTSNTIEGKPSQADFYPMFEKVESVEKGDTVKTIKEQPKTIVKSSNYNEQITPSSSQYFDVSSMSAALSALKTQLEKQQLFGAKEFTLKTLFNLTAKPNLKLTASYNGASYNGRIKSVNHEIILLGKNVAKGWTTINCGLIDNLNNVSLTTYKENTNYKPNTYISRPYTLGDISEVDQLMAEVFTRGSFS